MRHHRALIESHIYKEKYVIDLVTNLNNQLQVLSKVAETEPQSAYAAFVWVSKVNYSPCYTIPDISELLLPLEHTIQQKFRVYYKITIL